MTEIWLSGRYLQDNQLEECIMNKVFQREETENTVTLILHTNHLTSPSIKILASFQWNSLYCLHLVNNRIGNKGCRLISSMLLPNIVNLWLDKNMFDDEGILYLTKGDFKTLRQISVGNQHMKNQFQSLNKGHWPNICTIKYQALYNSSIFYFQKILMRECKRSVTCHLSKINVQEWQIKKLEQQADKTVQIKIQFV